MMTEQGERRTWRDRDDTEWEVGHRPAEGERPRRTALRCTTWAFVAVVPAGHEEDLGGDALQRLVDTYLGRIEEGPSTARIWTDPRSGIEWEVEPRGGELVFWSGTEAVRAPWGDGRKVPREMSDGELQEALDRAEAPH